MPGYLQLWDWQAEVKLSRLESRPVKQVWDEGSSFTMKDAGSKGGSGSADKSRVLLECTSCWGEFSLFKCQWLLASLPALSLAVFCTASGANCSFSFKSAAGNECKVDLGRALKVCWVKYANSTGWEVRTNVSV